VDYVGKETIMAVTFDQVKQILDGAIAGWSARTGRVPDLTGMHVSQDFGWADKQQLLDSVAHGLPLIAAGLIGNGRGNETNLVVALSNPDGVMGLGQMPLGGPFLSRKEIDAIIQWIDEGCN
jgi:hypothetical protein